MKNWEVHDGGRMGIAGSVGPSICEAKSDSCQPLFEWCGPEDAELAEKCFNLAATAPDLFAELKALVFRCEEAGWHKSETEAARAAIAKAEGK